MEPDNRLLASAVPPPLPAPPPPPVLMYQTPPPSPPRIWTSFVLFGAVMVTMLMFSATPLVVLLLIEEGPDAFTSPNAMHKLVMLVATPVGLISVALTNVLILSAATLFAAWLSPVPVRQRLMWRPPAASLLLLAVIALIGVTVSWSLSFLVSWMGWFDPDGGGIIAMMNQAFRDASGAVLLAMIISIGLLVPVAEELLFRGYMQSRLQLRLGPAAAVAISAALFGVLHLDPLHSPLAAVMGIYLGYVMVRTGSLWPPIVAHAAINIAAVLAAQFMPENLSDGITLSALLGMVLILLVGVAYIHLKTRGGANSTGSVSSDDPVAYNAMK